ncbi:MAG: Zn-dependent exopeptidase M28, partial [Anaerolineaceae bacterium]|nr:Zn-dependent exopeptidase M28 [Anaerolineaceae bacterium]
AGMQYLPNTNVDHYGYLEHFYSYNGSTWKNLILTIPGRDQIDPQEIILSAHLDDLPEANAPGAGDNGVGVAALLEIARVLRYFEFNATIKLIWFTGEEQGLRGSKAYVNDFGGPFFEDLVGVFNLDMFAYDSDGDDCFEIHAGDMAKSYTLGDCLVASIQAYSLPLTFDYLKLEIPGSISDHRPFWDEDVAAIELLENHSARQESDDYHQCGDEVDTNPYRHTSQDTVQNSVNVDYAFNIIKASLASAAVLSGPRGVCFNTAPVLMLNQTYPYIRLKWQEMGRFVLYRLYRSENGCDGPWLELEDNIFNTEYVDGITPSVALAYRLEAIDAASMCISLPSNCVSIPGQNQVIQYLPLIVK